MIASLLTLLLAAPPQDGFVRVGGAVAKPERIHYVDPARSLGPGLQAVGAIIVEVFLSEDGAPIDAKIIFGGQLKEAISLDAVKEWRYKPTLVDGHPVRVVLRELIEMFSSPDYRVEYWANIVRKKKETKGLRMFAIDQLRITPNKGKAALDALRAATEDSDPEIKAFATKVLAGPQ